MKYVKEIALAAVLYAVPGIANASPSQDVVYGKDHKPNPALIYRGLCPKGPEGSIEDCVKDVEIELKDRKGRYEPGHPGFIGKDNKYGRFKRWLDKKGRQIKRKVRKVEPDLVDDYNAAKRAGKRIWNKYTK
ncbi:TPA: hypothetical protein HA265_03730 [Candidatus Woesearchaeota archaeon]|nr:hypothetical protein [Candidatus Woesearchaeota archaeon]